MVKFSSGHRLCIFIRLAAEVFCNCVAPRIHLIGNLLARIGLLPVLNIQHRGETAASYCGLALAERRKQCI